jgi:hypothetical protein
VTGFKGLRLCLFLTHRLFGLHTQRQQRRRRGCSKLRRAKLSLALFSAPFLPPAQRSELHPRPLNCAQHYSPLLCKSSHETRSQPAHRKCHPPTLYVNQSQDCTHGGRLNNMLSLGFRSEESLSLSATVSFPQSLGDHVLNVNHRCMRQDLTIVLVCPRRVPQGICKSPYPAPLPFAHHFRSNPVSPFPAPQRRITLNTLNAAIFENYVAEIRLDGKPVQLALWDTAYASKHSCTAKLANSTLLLVARRNTRYLSSPESCLSDDLTPCLHPGTPSTLIRKVTRHLDRLRN